MSPAQSSADVPIPSTDPAGLVSAHESGAIVLDVREPEEWAAGHIADALHVPMSEVPAWLASQGRNAGPPSADSSNAGSTGAGVGPVVVVCRSGHRSGHVTAWLRAQDVDARNLDGGMLLWAVEHRPMVADTGAEPYIA